MTSQKVYKLRIIQTKATEQYFLELLFIILCKAFSTFQSADETLKYVQMKAMEQFFLVAPVITLFKVVLISDSVKRIPKSVQSNENFLAVVLFIMLHNMVLTF